MVTIRRMTQSDIAAVMRLKERAGWNQLETGIQRLLDLEPDGCFLSELEGRPAGTTTCCVFGPVAWIAMVLVEPALRQRGIATALMEHALAYLDARGVQTVRLDATPMGQPVYERLGFVAEYQLARWEGILPVSLPGPGSEAMTPDAIDDVIRLDREVTATDRGKLLARLYQEQPEMMRIVRRDGKLAGFLTSRPGARAVQVGPCIATAAAGPVLLADACRRLAGQAVYTDIPEGNRPATQLAEERGLTVQRRLLRMYRGTPIHEDIERLWASSGPEKG